MIKKVTEKEKMDSGRTIWKSIKSKGFKKFFCYGLGSGIGLEINEK